MSNSCTYRFLSSSLSDTQYDREYSLIIRQQPDRAKINIMNDRERRCIEPPPIIQMTCNNCSVEEEKKYLYSPFYFMVVKLLTEDTNSPPLPTEEYLSGPTVSSLYKLRDIDNSDAGFFVFSGLGVKKQGTYRLHFSFFELINEDIYNRKTIISDAFTVYLPRQFPGPLESTFLSRMFADQGVRMRTRKEHRYQTTSARKRKSDVQPHNLKRVENSRQFKPKNVPSPAYASENVYFGRWHSKHEDKQNKTDFLSLPPPDQLPRLKSTNSSPLPSIKDVLFDTSSLHTSCSTLVPENKQQLMNRLPPLRCVLKPEMIYSPLKIPLNRPFFGANDTIEYE